MVVSHDRIRGGGRIILTDAPVILFGAKEAMEDKQRWTGCFDIGWLMKLIGKSQLALEAPRNAFGWPIATPLQHRRSRTFGCAA